MRQPTMAIAVPIQNSNHCGAGLAMGNEMPPMVKPTTTTDVPTQEIGRPGLCARCAGSYGSMSASVELIPSTTPAACSATTPPLTHDLPMLRLSRKYRNGVWDSVAGPHLA